MTLPNLQVRRATIDDLPRLVPLWTQENLPVQELEKRFKEFQVAEGDQGELLGALAVQIVGSQALVHSEAFAHPEQADSLREKLWERSLLMMKNHGLVRVWTQHSSPFWHSNGFQPPSPQQEQELPPNLPGGPQPWRCLQLREAAAAAISLDKEFALFKESEQETTQRLFRQAKIMKVVAGIFAVLLLILVIVWMFFFFKTPLPRQ